MLHAFQKKARREPRVSALVSGKISKFSTGRRIRALLDLGQDVQLQLRPAAGGKGRGSVAAWLT